jgi:SAM-dependent methyltransferase
MTDDRDRPSERPEPEQRDSTIWWHSQVRYRYARELAAGKRALDIACGNGFGTIVLAEVASQVVGLDVSGQAVEVARQLNPRANVRYETVTKPPFPFPDASFDLVVTLETIEHMGREDQPAFIAELTRVLAPDGILVLSTPDRDTERAHDRMTGEPNPFHLHTPSREELETLLAAFPHRVELVERDFVATAIVPVDAEDRQKKLAAPLAMVGERELPAPVAVLRACARTEEGLERIRRARSPVVYRSDFQRLEFIAHVLSSANLPDISAFPVSDQLVFLAERLRRLSTPTELRFDQLEASNAAIWKNLDQLNRNLSVSGWLERLRGKRSK